MLPVERIIGEEGLSATDQGLRLAMRLPWYRSLPFSVVEVGGVTIDGAPVDLAEAHIEFGGVVWPLAENGEKTNAFWFVRDSAFLHMPGIDAATGSEHDVALSLFISPPYIPGMRRTNVQTQRLRVA
ncbi:C-glycoside deglycosidase beta subunit domain-containing protein [Rhizorhabdus sp. FW153]|uniref:C-glycoside deglycosidase beta subunit domain-containing protein n=1 Tax=Rhizorhabdus sp. FW153 TaxID=3400216 RepID=UPI003CEACA3A